MIKIIKLYLKTLDIKHPSVNFTFLSHQKFDDRPLFKHTI